MNCSVAARENMNELYTSMAAEMRQKLERHEEIKTMPPGTRLLSEGIRTEHLIIIKSGSVEVSISSAGKEIPIGIARAGKVFGLRSVVAGEAPEINATTLEDCTVALIPKNRFTEVLKQHHQIYFAVAKVLSDDLSMVNDLLRRIPRTANRQASR
ncbi:MAG TPA: Crp/Fnr family transcriptional regulator [Terriglobales bacterium]|jgi:CRP-like cAMP-binding protein|nr:Crp/Fnr family transcriptional regulator [Terriglobales bacterium]